MNVPVAAPRLALDFTSAASCASVRPWAAGNWFVCGSSAAFSSLTAGGIVAVLAVEVVVLVVAGELDDAAVVLDDELELEDPHPARARAIDTAASSVALVGILDFMFLL